MLHVLIIGTDVAFFFLLVHLVTLWRHIPWVDSFDQIGRPLVTRILTFVGNTIAARSNPSFSEKGRTIISLMVLSLIKLGVSLALRGLAS